MRSQRKDEHVALALQEEIADNDFDLIRFYHHSFPGLSMEDISLETVYMDREFAYPVYINAMTGGSEKTKQINASLAKIAKHYDLMMVVGSQHAALENPELEASYRIVREINPNGFIVGNLSPNASVEDAKRAIEMIDADALSIHVNSAQELSMDEGDRDFRYWLDNIAAIIRSVSVPVIVKEVGFGMSAYTVHQLIQRGVEYVDVSGRGGTNFIRIENRRLSEDRFSYLESWGLSTAESLLDVRALSPKISVFASGGIRNPLDVIKAFALGADAVGLSSYFLRISQMDSFEEQTQVLDRFFEDISRIMLLLGKDRIANLNETELILDGKLKRYV